MQTQPPPPVMEPNCIIKDIYNYQCEVSRMKEGEKAETIEGIVTSQQFEAVWRCKPLLRRFKQCVGKPTVEITFQYDQYPENNKQ